MNFKRIAAGTLHGLRVGLTLIALLQFSIGTSFAGNEPAQASKSHDSDTRTPIKHVIVIIGENRSFDHVFATYVPKHGESVWNLLSEGIIKADGTPGQNFSKYEQRAAADLGPQDPFLLSPDKTSFTGNVLPAPLVGGPSIGGKSAASYIPGDNVILAKETENGLPADYYPSLVSGGTLLTGKTPDTRIANVSNLAPGPFQITNGSSFTYTDYAASPVHRFYQMWQQLDCSLSHATYQNPSGCDAALFPWVEVTVGAGSSTQLNGLPQPPHFNTEYSPSPTVTTGEGSTAMAFYNVQQGDVPYFKNLADKYSMSDNFHQSVDGGTGANHIMLGHGDMISFSDGKGHAMPPPHGVATGGTTPDGTPTILDEVENPNPLGGTNNWYTEDGYGAGSFGSPAYGGGSYTDCADTGVSSIVNYLKEVHIAPNCEKGHYYLLNNYNPGFFGDGSNAFTDASPLNTVFTVPPSSTPSIGDDLTSNRVSWKYYGDQWNAYVNDKYQVNYGPVGSENQLGTGTIPKGAADEYCNICNPFQYDISTMNNPDPSYRAEHIQDTENLYSDIENGTLPAVSFVKPSGFVDGHPASSKLDLFEGFTKKIVDAVKKNPALWQDTAIFITFDEGGGYYDSGYVQPLDYFGDGTRIPLIVVSPYATGGHISHAYSDHVSILKFIERNWRVGTVSKRSRDNFPNPITELNNPYVPLNTPAISDLFDLFDFGFGLN